MITSTPIGKRAALGVLSAPRLRQLVDELGVEAADRKSKEALAGALEKHFLSVLVQLKRDELKVMCGALGIDASGKAKDEIMERIVAAVPPKIPASAPIARPSNGRAGTQLHLALPVEPLKPPPKATEPPKDVRDMPPAGAIPHGVIEGSSDFAARSRALMTPRGVRRGGWWVRILFLEGLWGAAA